MAGGLSKRKNPKAYFAVKFNFNVTNSINIQQRAEGGGQINKNVGTNANQGGQNAIKGSRTANIKSQFANGNGRSGNAGTCNKEVTDSEIICGKPTPCCKPSSVVVLKKRC